MRAAVLCCVAGADRDGEVPRRVPPGGGVRDGGGCSWGAGPGVCCAAESSVRSVDPGVPGSGMSSPDAVAPSRRSPLTPALQARGVGRSGRPSGCSPKVRPSFGGHVPLSGMRSSGPGRRADSQPGDSGAQLRVPRVGGAAASRRRARARDAASAVVCRAGRRCLGVAGGAGGGVTLRSLDSAYGSVETPSPRRCLGVRGRVRSSASRRAAAPAGVPTLRRRSGRGSRGGARRGGRGSGRGPRA